MSSQHYLCAYIVGWLVYSVGGLTRKYALTTREWRSNENIEIAQVHLVIAINILAVVVSVYPPAYLLHV